ncbi:MAG TPA: FAD-binding oxidoreductase, partial [Candidatus Limnocylindrales bacterium]
GDATYDAARAVWNGMIDRRPAIVMRPRTALEVAAALRFARDEDLRVAVRSGGHSLAGHSTCDDGAIIDLSAMRGVTIDPERRVARCNGGALLGELDDAAQAHGLACNSGTVSHTGIAGLTLGGGMGRLQRKLGLSIDCLRAVELVTADGRQVRASADEHADLFWGMRGAGPNFGIVTALEFDLWPVGPMITRGFTVFPRSQARDVAAAFRDYLPTAPDDLMASMIVTRALPAEDFPPEVTGEPVVMLGVTYAGPEADADRVLAPLAALGPGVRSTVSRQTHLESQHANDASMAWGHRIYTKSGFLADLPDALMDALVDHVADAPPGEDVFSIWAFGGAVGRLPDDATAFAGRGAPFWIGAESMWDDAADDDAHVTWGRAGIALTEPYRVVGRYVNDVTESGDEAIVRSVYGDAKYDRLVALKRAWDPDNVFRLNQNIRP